ncbi:MAG: helix-turn-helix transcriptional regulator [Proteobacteria bacterium]|nr:helix-turn-helix transcriptional regulator [Pseudomonadota bacterium]
MVKYNLKALIADKEFQIGNKITYDDIQKITGISKTTLSLIANKKGYKTNTDVVEKLCQYFNCTCDELMTMIPDKKE